MTPPTKTQASKRSVPAVSPNKPKTASAKSPNSEKLSPHKSAKSSQPETKHKITDRNGNRVYTVGLKHDFMVAYVKKPKLDQGAYLRPVQHAVTKHHNLKKKLNINWMSDRSDPHGGKNAPMTYISPTTQKGFTDRVFVRKLDNDVKNTPEERARWGNLLVSKFNKIGRNHSSLNNTGTKYKYPTAFHYHGDTSNSPLDPLADIITYDEAIAIMRNEHKTLTIEELANDDEIVKTYFGANNVKKARAFMLDQVASSSASWDTASESSGRSPTPSHSKTDK